MDLPFYTRERDDLNRNLLNVNQWMICSTPSVLYDGRTKKDFSFQGEYPRFYWQAFKSLQPL